MLELGPINDLYYMDKQYQTIIWYNAGIYDIFYVNYTEGNVIYKLLDTLHDAQQNRHADCIAHDYSLNRTFSLVYPGTLETQYLLTELHPAPQNETILMKLPANLRTSLIGTCAYCTRTHTFIALMANSTTFMTPSMMYSILLIDIIGLKYEVVEIAGLHKWTKKSYGYWPLTAVKFIPELSSI